jgi:hypothetical protein
MIAKAILIKELARRRTRAGSGHRASILTVTGVALLLFVGKTVGTAGELTTSPQGTTPVPVNPSAASGSGGDHASTDRASSTGKSDPGQVTPGQWLIDDVAKNRVDSGLKRPSPNPIPSTIAAPVEAGVGSRSPDDTRAGGDERGGAEATGSIGRPASPGSDGPPPSESRAGSVAPRPEDSPSPHQSLKRSDEHGVSTRPRTSLRLDDAAPNCAQAPAGQAPEGEHWHYRLDRKTQRKCWYVRGSRQDESRGRRKRSTSLDPIDAAWAWW